MKNAIDLLIQSKIVKESDRHAAMEAIDAMRTLEGIDLKTSSFSLPKPEEALDRLSQMLREMIREIDNQTEIKGGLLQSLSPLGADTRAAELLARCEMQLSRVQAYRQYLSEYLDRFNATGGTAPICEFNRGFAESIAELKSLYG